MIARENPGKPAEVHWTGFPLLDFNKVFIRSYKTNLVLLRSPETYCFRIGLPSKDASSPYVLRHLLFHKKEGRKGKVVRLASREYVYEAELAKGSQTGEIQVSADGMVIESLKWHAKGSKEENQGVTALPVPMKGRNLRAPGFLLSAFR